MTPDEMRYVPPKMETVIDIGQRVCTSGMMIEIALRLGLESLLEGPAFQEYARSVATSNYSFDQMFARSVRLESLFHILLESLEDGVIGINEKGEIFACSRQAEDMTCVSAALIQGKRCEEVFPYIPFAACLRARQTLPAKVIKVNSVNLSVEVVPVIRQNACIGAFATGMGSTDIAAGMALGETWIKVPPTIRVNINGQMPKWLRGKDLILRLIGDIGVDGALYKALEFGGELHDAMSGEVEVVHVDEEAGAVCAEFLFGILQQESSLTYASCAFDTDKTVIPVYFVH